MKIKSLLAGMLATTAFVACTNDVETVENGALTKGEKAYVAVNLVTNGTSSRTTDAPEYENGKDNEVKVGKVRFYFFGDNGAAYQVTDETHTKVNYIEVDCPTLNPNGSNLSVDKISNSVLVISKSKEANPKSLVAVLNVDELTGLGDGSLSLSELTKAVYDSTQGIAGTGENAFIMTNSVYVDAAGNTVVAAPITMDNICHATGEGNEEGALDHPVEIYVERVLAKVETSGIPNNKIFPIKDADKNQVKFGDKEVYVQLNGWAITNYNNRSNLFKSLEGHNAWDLSFEWNAPNNFRSFWAKSATPTAGEDYNATYKNDHKFSDLTTFDAKYCLENTSDDATELLVAATLVTKNGDKYQPLEIAQWMGVKYTVDDLKTQLAGTLASEYYYQVAEGQYVSITPDHIAFENPENQWTDEEKRYTVKATLATDEEGKEPVFYIKNGKEMSVANNTDIKNKLAKYPVMIWTGGATYYYLPIKHIGTEKGIVRNHLYDIAINGVTSFGTPVYNPDEVILPQTPVDDETYISAQINVLSWKVVSYGVELN